MEHKSYSTWLPSKKPAQPGQKHFKTYRFTVDIGESSERSCLSKKPHDTCFSISTMLLVMIMSGILGGTAKVNEICIGDKNKRGQKGRKVEAARPWFSA
ncbi:MAG: hypothetical protein M2R45_04978 [Verrucomicrobia subdivision 3 bacterium]|nr:hypothetical protein [Limisphaerales bacterium]MCS1414075.1 hypothetical protein [Limisphaerales bacterium]